MKVDDFIAGICCIEAHVAVALPKSSVPTIRRYDRLAKFSGLQLIAGMITGEIFIFYRCFSRNTCIEKRRGRLFYSPACYVSIAASNSRANFASTCEVGDARLLINRSPPHHQNHQLGGANIFKRAGSQ